MQGKPRPTQKKKLTYAEQIEYSHLEGDIDQLETEKKTINEQMQKNGDDYDKLADLQTKKDDLDSQIDKKMQRWEYLSEFAE